MLRHRLLPMWAWFLPAAALSVTGMLRRTPERWRGLAVGLLPLALALPAAVRWTISSDIRNIATLGGSYLVALTLFLAPPVFAWAVREGDEQARRLLWLAAPAGLLGWLAVVYFSSASLVWGSPVVGLAPLTAALLVCGVALVGSSHGRGAAAAMTCSVLAVLVLLLFSLVYQDGSALALTKRFDHGPLAGIATSAARYDQATAIEAVADRWVRPSSKVLFIGNPGGYLVVGGQPQTDAVWIGLGLPGLGPLDDGTVRYYDTHAAPDVVFITDGLLARNGGFEQAAKASPLVAFVAKGYRLAEGAGGVQVYVRR